MNLSQTFQPTHVSLKNIDREDTLTDFSMAGKPAPAKDLLPEGSLLESSIREIGVVHPVVLLKTGGFHKIISGHQRVRVCEALNIAAILANLTESDLSDADRLDFNLRENRPHRQYSDIEKGLILEKLRGAGIAEDRIIVEYLPLLDLDQSMKLYQRLTRASQFSPKLLCLLHELRIPLRIFSSLLDWDARSRDAAENLFSLLRPGANKWRDLLELIDETAGIKDTSPAGIVRQEDIQTLLHRSDLSSHEKYDSIFKTLYSRRYPVLSDLRGKVARALDQLRLDGQTRIQFGENFENEEIRIELKFRDQVSLMRQVEKLAAAARSQSMAELIQLLKF